MFRRSGSKRFVEAYGDKGGLAVMFCFGTDKSM